MEDDLFDAVVGDGRSLLIATALVLMGSGAFASFQAATGHFLPHDTAYLGMTAADLCRLQGCRILYFMIHDRISFGGVLIATGAMYLWLAAVPLRKGEAWAWWALAASGVAGFLSFLAFLGYGYLDTWHGAATLALLPLFASGMFLTRALRSGPVRPSGEYRFEAVGDGTRLSFALRAELSGIKKLLMSGAVQKTMDAEVAATETLKRLLETPPAG